MNLEFDVSCQRCGFLYTAATHSGSPYNITKPVFKIEPCYNCLVNERSVVQQESWQNGYNQGFVTGREQARKDLKDDIREMVKLTQEA